MALLWNTWVKSLWIILQQFTTIEMRLKMQPQLGHLRTNHYFASITSNLTFDKKEMRQFHYCRIYLQCQRLSDIMLQMKKVSGKHHGKMNYCIITLISLIAALPTKTRWRRIGYLQNTICFNYNCTISLHGSRIET
jgi:hypothetical protein